MNGKVVGVTEFDKKTAERLRGIIDELAAIRAGMYQSGHGCACDERGLCALHADIYSRLTEAADSLALAVGKALSDG